MQLKCEVNGIEKYFNKTQVNYIKSIINKINKVVAKEKKIKIDKFYEITFVDKKKIKELNNKYRKTNAFTDVLTFVNNSDILLGEIYVCLPYIVENQENMYFVITHGILHLFNYTHETIEKYIKIVNLQNKILKLANIKN